MLFGVDEVPAGMNIVVSRFSHVVDLVIIPVDPGTNSLYHRFVNYGSAAYLIRPDLYIGWCSDSLDASGLNTYLKRFFKTHAEIQGV